MATRQPSKRNASVLRPFLFSHERESWLNFVAILTAECFFETSDVLQSQPLTTRTSLRRVRMLPVYRCKASLCHRPIFTAL